MAYDTRTRAAAARATRTRILTAARVSFLDRGFAGTTIRVVAAEAAVSQETIYKTFGGKAGLLKAVYDTTLVGDEENVPLAQRRGGSRCGGRPHPTRRWPRTQRSPGSSPPAPIRSCVCSGARGKPTLRSRRSPGRSTRERRVGSGMAIDSWHAAGWLRHDLDPDKAADIMWALNSPEPRWLLLDSGWTTGEFTAWLAQTLREALLR